MTSVVLPLPVGAAVVAAVLVAAEFACTIRRGATDPAYRARLAELVAPAALHAARTTRTTGGPR